jgi:hypothetical protein
VKQWAPATNAEMQSVFGGFHRSSYDVLRRSTDRGYLQIEQWTRTAKAKGKRSAHVLTWAYGISLYASEADAESAINDMKPLMSAMPAGVTVLTARHAR